MKVVAKSDEYTIYQRRDQRYAVKDGERQWVNGDAKVAILLEHKLIDVVAAKPAPEPEPEVVEAAGDEAPVDDASEAGASEAGASEAEASGAEAPEANAEEPAADPEVEK